MDEKEYQTHRISRLQIALQRIKYVGTVEEARHLAKAFLEEDHVARRRQAKGDFRHPCYDKSGY